MALKSFELELKIPAEDKADACRQLKIVESSIAGMDKSPVEGTRPGTVVKFCCGGSPP